MREVKAGRGSPHGGVFLDIAWIKARLPSGAEHIKKKLPSMYHQFKQLLADLDITQESMEIGPTTHYIMGGVRVNADTLMSTVAGLFAAGECAAGINGANRLGGNSLSYIIVFGKRAGEDAAAYASTQEPASIDPRQVDEAARRALEPFERGTPGEGLPFVIYVWIGPQDTAGQDSRPRTIPGPWADRKALARRSSRREGFRAICANDLWS